MRASWRTRFTLATCSALTALLVVTAGALAGFGDRTLSIGMEGGDVEKLQSILKQLGYDVGVDGRFGPRTEKRVKQYERDERIPVDGTVDRSEAKAMKAQLDGATPEEGDYRYGERKLRRGDRGDDVARLQRLLTRIGIETLVNGKFGGATERSVMEDERNEGIRVNGSVSPDHALSIEKRANAEEESSRETDPAGADDAEAGGDGRNHTFPVRGPHDYGGPANRFGAPRGGRAHMGHDIFATEGTPLAAVHDGRVTAKQYQAGGAGNYVVIRGEDGLDSVYMHMRTPAKVGDGDRVRSGDKIGEVGCTGSCTGSHVHFELWTPHWYDGGKAFDPLHKLKHWDENS